MLRRLSFSLVALALVALTTRPAQAVVLCAKPRSDGTFNTSVRIREACKAGETQLDPGALGLQGPQGPTGPAALLKDAMGVVVGVMVQLLPPVAVRDEGGTAIE